MALYLVDKESWNAFEDAITHLSLQGGEQSTELQVPGQEFLPSSDGHLLFGVTEVDKIAVTS